MHLDTEDSTVVGGECDELLLSLFVVGLFAACEPNAILDRVSGIHSHRRLALPQLRTRDRLLDVVTVQFASKVGVVNHAAGQVADHHEPLTLHLEVLGPQNV